MKNNHFHMVALIISLCIIVIAPLSGAQLFLGQQQAGEIPNYHSIFTVFTSDEDIISYKYQNYDIIALNDCGWMNEPGNPFLPRKELHVAVPSDIIVTDVKILSIHQQRLSNSYFIFPAQPPLRTDGSPPETFIHPNEHIYNFNTRFPKEDLIVGHQCDLAGQPIVTLHYYPLHYLPKEEAILLTTSITFELIGNTGYICGDYLSPFIDEHIMKKTREDLQQLVLNPLDVRLTEDPGGTPMTLDLPSGGPYDYVIIGASGDATYWNPLIEWRTKTGMKATYVTTSYIYNEYSGSDNQQKIRNFVIDARNNWGTMYFLIAGEHNDVPFEYRTYVSDSIPSDEYYADYDDDWTMEVYVGRVTASSSTEVDRFIDKILKYEQDPPLSNYILDCTLLGMDLTLASEPPYYELTRGEYLKEDIDSLYVPSRFTITEVYDTDSSNHRTDFINALNDGQNLVNHNDHSYTTVMGCGDRNHGWDIDNGDVDALINYDKLSNIYSLGCHPNEMDYNDCISEHFVIYNSMQAGVSFTGNTRSGWFYVGEPEDGLSCGLDRDWWRGIFNYNKFRLGEALYYTKQNNPHSDDHERYCQWTLNLLGDPAMPLWLDDPIQITATHPVEVSLGSSPFTVDTNSPLATICLWKDEEVYEVATADSSGDYTFTINPTTPGIMFVTVTNQDYLPYEADIIVSDMNHPPYEPMPINPDDGEIDVPIETTLVWTGGDQDIGDTVEYEIFFDTNPDPEYLTTTPMYYYWEDVIYHILSPLNLGTTYYWKIKARDNHGEETTSDIWSFTTESPPEYTLTININGQGTVNKNPDWPTYPLDTIVELTAVEDLGWIFDHWSDDLQGSENPDTLVMDEDKTVTAHFTQLEYTLTTTVEGMGEIIVTPDQPTYYYGDIVQLRANAEEGWYFDEWSGDATGTLNPIQLTIVDDMTVTATFLPGGYILDLSNFPMYQAQGPNYNEYCGPAVAQMTLNYIWWNQTRDPTIPLLYYDQQWLYDQGLENTSDPTIPYLDAQGLWKLLQGEKPDPYSEYGYNFIKKHTTDLNEILKQICAWIDYPIGTVGGYKPGHPDHVPGLVPAYGDYSNWMAIRGIHTDQHAYPIPGELTVYGFWVNDPLPGGIGENSYKTIDTWTADYYQILTSNDYYDGEYVAICEPPETTENQRLIFNYASSQFTSRQQYVINYLQKNQQLVTPQLQTILDQWIIQAATKGITEQLLDHDESLAELFKTSIPGTPIFVSSLKNDDYYLVPFNDPSTKDTLIVVRIQGGDGQFLEASWVQEPVPYLPVTKHQAQQLAFTYLEEQGIELLDETGELTLIHRHSSPFLPEWQISFGDTIVLVSQQGTVSLLQLSSL